MLSPRALGWRLVAGAGLILAAQTAAALAVGDLDGSLRELIRVTARTSLVWFALAFAARPLVALRPGPASKWLLRHRRHLGLAMAVSHGGHLAAIVGLAARQGPGFWRPLAASTVIGGGLGYVLLAAMTATSFDRSAAWLGRRRWRGLHRAGMWWFWAIFTLTYLGQLGRSWLAVIAVTAMIAVAALRIAAQLRGSASASAGRRSGRGSRRAAPLAPAGRRARAARRDRARGRRRPR